MAQNLRSFPRWGLAFPTAPLPHGGANMYYPLVPLPCLVVVKLKEESKRNYLNGRTKKDIHADDGEHTKHTDGSIGKNRRHTGF